jgi:hypothetical protein
MFKSSNCNIDFFNFRHRFHITSVKFLNSEKVCKLLESNTKFQNWNYEIPKVNEMEQNCHLILFNTIRFHLILLNVYKKTLLTSLNWIYYWLYFG